MGIMTDNFQQLNRTIQNQTTYKMYKKDCKENYEIYLFPIIWNKFATDGDIEKTHRYFKSPAIMAQYIQLTEIATDNDNVTKIMYFNELTLAEKTKIYINILNLIYKSFKYDCQEEEKRTENKKEKINILGYIILGFLGSLFFGKYKKKYKF